MYPRVLGISLCALLSAAVSQAASTATISLPSTTAATTTSLTLLPVKTPVLSPVAVIKAPPPPTRPAWNCPSSATSCQMYMPLYDQTNNIIGKYWLPNGGQNSMLCGPTSAAMALQGQIYYGGTVNPPKAGSWTAATFEPLPWYQQVGVMASLVDCSPTSGTLILPWLTNVYEADGVAGRAGDFTEGGHGSTSFWPTDIQGSDLEPNVRNRTASVTAYGHYYRSDTYILGVDWITFSRNGGHFIAASGFWRNDGSANDDTIVWNDPWGGVNDYYRINQIQGGMVWQQHSFLGIPYWTLQSVTILPVVGTQAGYVINSGTYYGILEAHTDLGIN